MACPSPLSLNMVLTNVHYLLLGYFDAIRHSPFQYHQGTDELSEVFFNPDHQGYLTKEGGKHKSWRKRWFILTDNCLYYFKSPSDKEPLGIIPLENLEVRECTDTRKNVSTSLQCGCSLLVGACDCQLLCWLAVAENRVPLDSLY